MNEEEIVIYVSVLLLCNQLPQAWQLKMVSVCYLRVLWVRSPGQFKWVLGLESHRLKSRCCLDWALSCRLWEESSYRFVQLSEESNCLRLQE